MSCFINMTLSFSNMILRFVNIMLCYSSGTASDSICPKGWRLPGISGGGSYRELLKLYSNRTGNISGLTQGDTVAMLAQLSFLRSGSYHCASGSLSLRTSYGYYWSGHYDSIADSYYLYFYSTNLYPQNGNRRGFGFALRCLAR